MENSSTTWKVTSLITSFLSFLSFVRLNPTEKETTESIHQDNIPPEVKEIYELITNPEREVEEDITQFFQTIGSGIDFGFRFKEGNTFIHEAVIHKKPKILKELLSRDECTLNSQNEQGNTPLISLLKACVQCGEKFWNKIGRDWSWNDLENENGNENENIVEEKNHLCEEHLTCFQILMEKTPQKDAKNKLGLNAVSYATMCPPKQRVKYLTAFYDKATAEQINNDLYKYLSHKWDPLFLEELKKCRANRDILNFMWKDATGEYTLIEITCRWGMIKSMKFLIETRAKIEYADQPNLTRKSLFHIVVKDITNSKKALECLKILLNFSKNVGDIDEQDIYGRTPLHYAVTTDNDDLVVELLENGASLFIKDKWNETPLMNISRSALKKFLNNMITDSRFKEHSADLKTHKKSSDKELRSIIMKFEKLMIRKKKCKENSGITTENNQAHNENVRGKRQKDTENNSLWNNCKKLLLRTSSEESDSDDTDEDVYKIPTKFLCKIKDSRELQTLLAHPVFSIIIYFKWLKCRSVFLTCQILFLLFSIVYTYFIVTYGKNASFRSSSLLLQALYNNLKNPRNVVFFTPLDFIQNILLVILSILIILFLFLEILKIIHQKFKYFCYISNVLRLLGIYLSTTVLIKLNTCICNELKAVSILITWLDFAFTVGEYPSLAVYISIFRRAIVRLTQFLIVYSGLLFGFSLSFHFLFGSKNPEFSNVFDSFFKTLGILSGDFGADNIPFHLYPITSRLIFTLYIFVTTLILINIMAEMIAKVKILSESRFLHKMLAQVDIIKQYENNYTKNQFFTKIRNCIVRSKNKEDVNGENAEDNGFIFEITLNGEKYKLNHQLVFEDYPEEKVRIRNVSGNKSTIQKFLGYIDFVGLFEEVDDIIIQKTKKIIKKKSKTNKRLKKDDEILTLDIFMKKMNDLEQKINQTHDRAASIY